MCAAADAATYGGFAVVGAGVRLQEEGAVMLTGGEWGHYKLQEKQRKVAVLRPSCRDAAAEEERQGSGCCGGAGGSR